jgi:hypothetical protein
MRLSHALCGLFLSLILNWSAYAFLGGAPDSYPPYTSTIKILNNYTTTETTAQYGVVITEFSNSSNAVFAINWSGPTRPDMTRLLGNYFSQYQTLLNQAKSLRGGLYQKSDDLVIFSHANLRNFSGYAYLPAQLPNGFDLNTLK